MQKACVTSSKRHSCTKCAACQAILRCHNYCSNDTSHIDTSFLASFYYRQQLLMNDRFPITGWLIEAWSYLVIMASVRHNRCRSTNLNVWMLSCPYLCFCTFYETLFVTYFEIFQICPAASSAASTLSAFCQSSFFDCESRRVTLASTFNQPKPPTTTTTYLMHEVIVIDFT